MTPSTANRAGVLLAVLVGACLINVAVAPTTSAGTAFQSLAGGLGLWVAVAAILLWSSMVHSRRG